MGQKRREITLEELAAMKAAGASMSDVKVKGMIKIIDKDGKIKGELPIERIDDAN